MTQALAVDTSALFAILNHEAEGVIFLTLLGQAEARFISAATLHEAHCVDTRSGCVSGMGALSRLVAGLRFVVVPFDEEMLAIAQAGYSRFGRGSGHPAKLNMGDCFSYALARTRNLPLLFKGDDFPRTDVSPAVPGRWAVP